MSKRLADEAKAFAAKVRKAAEDSEPGTGRSRLESAAKHAEDAALEVAVSVTEAAEAARHAESVAADEAVKAREAAEAGAGFAADR